MTIGHVKHKTKPVRQSYESPSEPVRTTALERCKAGPRQRRTTSLNAGRLVVACGRGVSGQLSGFSRTQWSSSECWLPVEECSHLTQLLRTMCASPGSGIVGMNAPPVSPVTKRGSPKSLNMRGQGLSIFRRCSGSHLRQHASLISHGLGGPNDIKSGIDGGGGTKEDGWQSLD